MDRNVRRQPRQFFATVPVPCPYLPNHAEQKLVIELKGRDPETLYQELARAGFRRSHGLAYKPACKGCGACVPVRIAVSRFEPTRSLRRVARRNADLAVTLAPPRVSEEQFRLFRRYLDARHSAGGMAQMTYDDYRSLIEQTAVRTALAEFRDPAGTLLAGCLVDRLPDALSAVYSFFAPERANTSLGTYMILAMIDEARRRGLSFVYLGYWIQGSETMHYKRRFPALEGLTAGAWTPLPPLDP